MNALEITQLIVNILWSVLGGLLIGYAVTYIPRVVNLLQMIAVAQVSKKIEVEKTVKKQPRKKDGKFAKKGEK